MPRPRRRVGDPACQGPPASASRSLTPVRTSMPSTRHWRGVPPGRPLHTGLIPGVSSLIGGVVASMTLCADVVT